MLGSSTFELVLGMVFVFLLLSLVVSTIREALEARLKTRAQHLARGIAQLLGNDARTRQLFEFPLIKALYDGEGKVFPATFKNYTGASFVGALGYFLWRIPNRIELPSYVPKRTFALALLQLAKDADFLKLVDATVVKATGLARLKQMVAPAIAQPRAAPTVQGPVEVGVTSPPVPAAPAANQPIPADPNAQPAAVPAKFAGKPDPALMNEIKAILKAHPTNDLSRSLQAVLSLAGDDVEKAVTGIEQWYDGTMDRVSGWYKRESQHILFWLGLVVAVLLNVDSIFLVKYLNADADARNRLAYMASKYYSNADNMAAAKSIAERDMLRQGLPAPAAASASGGATTAADKSAADKKAMEKKAAADKKASTDKLAADKAAAATSAPQASAPAASDAASGAAGTETPPSAAHSATGGTGLWADVRQITDLNLPIGWTPSRISAMEDWKDWVVSSLGWFVTAFALSFGAPFWFDFFNKMMVIRSTVKPTEKSPDEPSEDAQVKKPPK